MFALVMGGLFGTVTSYIIIDWYLEQRRKPEDEVVWEHEMGWEKI